MSIYSGSFGHHKASYTVSQDDYRNIEEGNNDREEHGVVDIKDDDNLVTENDKIRWVPNDAYENCQI